MPLVDGKPMSPDDAMAAGRCPECGDDLRTQNPIAHRRSHWSKRPNDDEDGREGLRRMAMFDKFIADNNVRTTNMEKPAPKAGAAAATTDAPKPADETREQKIARLHTELAAAEAAQG